MWVFCLHCLFAAAASAAVSAAAASCFAFADGTNCQNAPNNKGGNYKIGYHKSSL